MRPFVIVGFNLLIILMCGCATRVGKFMSIDRWRTASNDPTSGQIPVAPEVLYVVQCMVQYHRAHNAFPASVDALLQDQSFETNVAEFLRRNVEIVGQNEAFTFNVWDLHQRRNTITVRSDDQIAINTEVYGTGSRDRMHSTNRSADALLQAIFNGIR